MSRANRQVAEKRCRACNVVKAQAEFPEGRTPKRRAYMCWPCTEERAWAIHDRGYLSMAQRRATREVDGVLMRRCSRCRIEKPLLADFYKARRDAPLLSLYSYECKSCSHRSAAETTAAKMATARGDATRARRAKRGRELRATPEGKAKHGAAQKRYAAKVKEDPRRHAEYLEMRRVAYRLRREREGRPVTRKYRNAARVEAVPNRVPVEPLLAFIDKTVERRSAVVAFVGEARKGDGVLKEVCRDFGINDRTYRRWRAERGTVSVGIAERVLLNAEVEWHDVYSYDDHAAAFLAIEVEA